MQILFLNKIDLFAEKLPHSPLGDYFPDYNGGDNYDAACDYLLHRFVALNQNAATKQIYAHYTCATDTQQIRCKDSPVIPYFTQANPEINASCAECYSGYPATNPSSRVWSAVMAIAPPSPFGLRLSHASSGSRACIPLHQLSSHRTLTLLPLDYIPSQRLCMFYSLLLNIYIQGFVESLFRCAQHSLPSRFLLPRYLNGGVTKT